MKNTDRRVSIKQNQPVVVEYLSEKRPSIGSQIQHQIQMASNAMGTKSTRPASLVVTKGDRPTFKLIRTPSIDNEQEFPKSTELNANQQPNQSATVQNSTVPDAHNTGVKDDDEYDESAPLVRNADSTIIKTATNFNTNSS